MNFSLVAEQRKIWESSLHMTGYQWDSTLFLLKKFLKKNFLENTKIFSIPNSLVPSPRCEHFVYLRLNILTP